MSDFDKLRTFLLNRSAFTEDELALLESLFVPKTLSAGEFLLRAGEVSRNGAFVATGCLRMYVIDDKGKEHIVQFAPENWWAGDISGLTSEGPSRYFIDAIEDSSLLLIDRRSHERAIESVPGYAAGFRAAIQRAAAAKDQRIVDGMSTSAEERYEKFLSKYPSIALRVPQRMLASYLGVTPETLSRVRKDRSRK